MCTPATNQSILKLKVNLLLHMVFTKLLGTSKENVKAEPLQLI